MPKLVLLQGGQAIPYSLTEASTVLGRLPECTIQLKSNMVSRRHAEVEKGEDERFFVRDLESGNGTFVNGKKIEGRTLLKHNDRIKLGPILFRFEAPETNSSDTVAGKSESFLSEEEQSTIMGSASKMGGFGMLDVQPEAKLKCVLEISRDLVGAVSINAILPKLLDTLFRIFPGADRGIVLLRDRGSGVMIPAAQKLRNPMEDETVKLSRTILSKILEEKKGILSADASSDVQFNSAESISALSIRSVMCVPMLDLENELIGVINIDTLNPIAQFKQDDLELLMAVAGQASLTVANAILYESHLEKQKQDSEMNIAHNVQLALLPDVLPEVEGYRFFASYESAMAVGGDYYDCFMLRDHRVCVSFGDVAGKGVPASLVMSRISSIVRCTMQHEADLAKAIQTINNMMCSDAVSGRFVTYVLVVIDLNTNLMTLVNGGHMSPIIFKPDGSMEEFPEDSIGIPIGIMPDYPYEIVSRTLNPEETVIIYTDGVSEAMNPAEELYGMERLYEIIKLGSHDPEEVGIRIREDVRKHAQGQAQNDDITLMTFGRT
ncbi:MAG TPA: SpoIIE family protein phosphatase [Planctomycetaceae bacterium]|nr:SpoIIE family protein phosphatase [Planctomycetaceae bacterium]